MNFFGNGSKEQRLVKRLQDGDKAAAREFYTHYAESLAGICSRYIANEEDLKDVFQNALIHIFSHIGDFEYRGEGSLQNWASRIVVNESLKFLRSTKRHELLLLDHEVIDEHEDEDPPISNVPPDEIHRMVSELPTGCRTIFNLYVFENKSHQEIASLLGIKVNSSASQLSRAKNLLAKKITAYNNSKQHSR